MGPERRQSVRKKVRLDIAIMDNRSRISSGKIRDMNLDGVFAELEGTAPRIGERLQTTLHLPHRQGLHRIRFPATVLRTEPGGAALKFEEYDLPTYKILVSVLYSR